MNKLLFLLILGSFSIQISAMDERPSKRQKKSEETSNFTFFEEQQSDFDNSEEDNFSDDEPESDLEDERYKTEKSADLTFLAYENSNPNIVDHQLFNAVQNTDEEAVKEALDKGANPNIKDNNGFEILISAANKGNKEIVQLLLSNAKIQLDYDILGWALCYAARNYNYNILDLFIQRGANINYQNIYFTSPLIAVTSQIPNDSDSNFIERYLKTTKFLIKNGANLNIQSENGVTALMNVVIVESYCPKIFKDSDLIPYLLKHGALINIKNYKGDTALDIAKRLGDKRIVELLENKIKERAKAFQQQIKQKILETTPLPEALTSLTSEYLEGVY